MANYGTNVNLNKNELQNAKIHNLGSAPASPVAGQLYYNTGDGNIYVYDGIATGWVDLTQQSTGSVDASTTVKGVNKMSVAPAVAANPIAVSDNDPRVIADQAAGTASIRTVGTGALQAMAGNTTLSSIAAPTGSVSLNSQKIVSLATPTTSTDAATKQYVDDRAGGFDWHESVVAKSTANVNPAAFAGSTIDGITLANGNRILLTDQTTTSENGIWVFNGAGSALTRPADADNAGDLSGGSSVYVEQGTANADSIWAITTDGPITPGTTNHVWTQTSGLGQISAGNGLTKTGNTLNVVGTANRISVAADSVDIDAAYVGQTTITTLGTVATGTWNATTIGLTKGGTGQTTAPLARDALAEAGYTLVRKYTQTIGDGATTTFNIDHNLNTSDVKVAVRKVSTGDQWAIDVNVVSVNRVALTFAVAPTASEYAINVQG